MSDREDADYESDGQAVARTQKQQTLQEPNKQAGSGARMQSRSASRRARRNRIKEAMESGKYMKTTSLEALEEADRTGELSMMQSFERIGPDSTSMDGPVTKARAMRGEIPMRGSNPNQPYRMPEQKMGAGGKSLDDEEGLKLKLEANLDVEIELKASIRGDLTLSLFA